MARRKESILAPQWGGLDLLDVSDGRIWSATKPAPERSFRSCAAAAKIIPLFVTGVVVLVLVLGWLGRDEEI